MDRTELTSLIREMPLVSSHCHHGQPDEHAALTLDQMLGNSYVGWCYPLPEQTAEQRARYVDEVGANTYFVWLSQAVAELYGHGEIEASNWDEVSASISAAHGDPEQHFSLLSEKCRYRFVVQDCYWEPGSDHGRPEMFHPTYRINCWAMCHSPGMIDHNDNSPWLAEGFDPATVEEYLELLEASIAAAKETGSVAINSALAYDRPVAFDDPDMNAAKRAFRAGAGASPEDASALGDVVIHKVCEVAGNLDLPFQVHLGLGILGGSRPMLFEPLVAKYPQTTFDLFHCGYPWCDEIGGLLHNYPNVVADLCWLPLISTTRAVGALHEYLDVAQSSDRIVWGDDTWT
ncbi:MAG TPA: amidohydrolase family protein, partial [Armatimonadota bacterium]|nr:amidohydrolase family protein [Armatimonadota bacterium]